MTSSNCIDSESYTFTILHGFRKRLPILNFYKFEMWKIRFKKMQSLNRLDSHPRSQCVPSLYQLDRGVLVAPVVRATTSFRGLGLGILFCRINLGIWRGNKVGSGRAMDDSRFWREKKSYCSPKLCLGPDYLLRKQIEITCGPHRLRIRIDNPLEILYLSYTIKFLVGLEFFSFSFS